MKLSLNDSKVEVIERDEVWPELNLSECEQTYDAVHLWLQIVGKIKLEFTAHINHWWNITFYLSGCGLTTGVIPCKNDFFELAFDFTSHQLFIIKDNGHHDSLELRSGSVADFYLKLKDRLSSLGININIWPMPVEMEDRLPFDKDFRARTYDPEYANRYWRALTKVSRVMNLFRSDFTGKASPIHVFWGSFDIAVTFFSGRKAPEHPGAPNIGKQVMVEAYNSELASFGFWGGKGLDEAAFYAYAYPEPLNYKTAQVKPAEAYYNNMFREFILPYSSVRKASDPDKIILDFFRSTFITAEKLSNWDKSLYTKTSPYLVNK